MIPIEYSTPLLALLLFFPVSKLIWVLSVRRLQRRLARELSPEELNAQLKRARILGAVLALLTSWLFNTHLLSTLRDAGYG
jgi:hypothetical protein